MYVLISREGQIYNFRIHTGTTKRNRGQVDLEASGNIVKHRMSKMLRTNWYKLVMDNSYTGVPLVSTLMQQGISVVWTVPSNGFKGSVLSNDKVMRQKGRDLSEVKTCAINGIEVRAIRWLVVCFAAL